MSFFQISLKTVNSKPPTRPLGLSRAFYPTTFLKIAVYRRITSTDSLYALSIWQLDPSVVDVTWESSEHFATPPLVSPRKEQISHAASPIRSLSQIWVSFLRRHFAWKPVVVSRNVGCFLKLLLNISFTTWASDGYHTWMIHCSDSLLAEVSHRKREGDEVERPLVASDTFFITHALASPWEPVTFQSRAIQLAEPVCAITTVSSGHAHYNLKETSFENQEVSTTNVVGGCMKGCVGCRQRSFSFLSFFACGTGAKKTGLSG